jgi:hypothetical protein
MILIDHEYSIVELEYTSNDALEWCLTTFGDPNEKKWFSRGNKVYFYNAHDHLMFVLRWS